jgi:hypothetical protein
VVGAIAHFYDGCWVRSLRGSAFDFQKTAGITESAVS